MTPLRRLRRAAIDVEPLRHPDFRRLWLGNSLGFIGFQLIEDLIFCKIKAFAMGNRYH